MANPTVNSVSVRSFRGHTPVLAAGRGVGDFGAIAASSGASMVINDMEVTPNMNVFAQVQSSPAANFVILSAVAGNKTVTISVGNVSLVAATAGPTTIAYYCTQNQ